MDKRRPDTLIDMRRQRVRLRRIGTVVLLAGGLFALVSCEELTQRNASSSSSTASPNTLQGGVAARRP